MGDDWIDELFGGAPKQAGDWIDEVYAPTPEQRLQNAASAAFRGVSGVAGAAGQAAILAGSSIINTMSPVAKEKRRLKGIPSSLVLEQPSPEAMQTAQGFGQTVGKVANAIIPRVEKLAGSFWGEKVPEFLGGGAAFLGTGGVLKALGVPAELSMMSLGAMTQGAAGFEDARLSGASPEDQWGAFLMNLGVGAATGYFSPLKGMLARADQASVGTLQKALIHGLVEGAQGAGVMAASQAASDAIAKHVLEYDKDRDILKRALESGETGFVGSLLLSAAASAAFHQKAPEGKAGAKFTDVAPAEPKPTGRTVAQVSEEARQAASVGSEKVPAEEPKLPVAPAEAASEAAPVELETLPDGVPPGTPIVRTSEESRALFQRYGPPNALTFPKDTGAVFVDESGAIVAYRPPKARGSGPPKSQEERAAAEARIRELTRPRGPAPEAAPAPPPAAAQEPGAEGVPLPVPERAAAEPAPETKALEDAYLAAKGETEALGPEPHKPSSETKFFGARGREGASPEVVARYDAEVSAHSRWKRRYSKLKKAEVEAGNELHRALQSSRPAEAAPEPSMAPQLRSAETPPPTPAPEPAPQGQEARAAEEPAKTTSIKNAVVDRELEAMGLPPAEHGESTTDLERHGRAMEKLQADPEAGARLVTDLEASQRPPTGDEGALLALEVNRLIVERDAAQEAFNAEPSEANQARIDKAVKDYARAADVVTKSGTESSASLRIRKMMIARDYSLAAMERSVQVAKGGEPLTPEESAQVAELHGKLAAAQRAHEEYVTAAEAKRAELEAENAMLKLKREVAARPKRATREKKIAESRAKVDRIIEELATLGQRARAQGGLDPELIGKTFELAKASLEFGYQHFAAWAEEMTAKIGEHVRPYLEQAWEAAKAAHIQDLGASISEAMKKGAKLEELGQHIERLSKHFVEQGITERDALVDAVHEVLQKTNPGITRSETRDAISGYGKFRRLSKIETAVTLRRIKGELQQVGKLEDLAKKIPPKKTGVEHREPSADERRLIKQVNELKKKLGIKTTDPATQLRSALDQTKARLRHQIEDLTHQIETRTETVRGKSRPPTDAEVEAMRARRDELRAQFDAIFHPPKETPDPAIARLETNIADLSRRIAERDLAPRGEKQGPDTEPVAKLKAQRDALRDQLEGLRKAAKPEKTQAEIEAQKIEAATKAVQKSIADIETRIAAGDTSKNAQEPGPSTPELKALRARRDALRAELDQWREAAKPVATDAEIAAKKERMALKAYKTRKANEVADLAERMEAGEFGPKPKPRPVELDPEAVKLKADYEEVRQKFEREKEKYRLANRTKTQKILGAVSELTSLARAVKASWDDSAVLGQALAATAIHPWRALTVGIPDSFRAISARKALEIDTALRSRPMFGVAEKAGFKLRDIEGALGPQEELFRGRLAHKIPGVAASDRAFTTYANTMGSFTFDKLIESMPGATPEEIRAASNFANLAVGHAIYGTGPISGKASKVYKGVGEIMWSPQKLLSRIQLALGQPMWSGTPRSRARIAALYARMLVGVGAYYGATMFFAAGADEKEKPTIETNPLSSDFLKVKVGDTRVDPLGGLSQATVLAWRLGAGEMKNSTTGEVTPVRGKVPYGKANTNDLIMGFLQNHLAPTYSFPMMLMRGIDPDDWNETLTVKKALREAFLPLSFEDIYKAMQAQGMPKAAAFAMLAFFGASLQTYAPKQPTAKKHKR